MDRAPAVSTRLAKIDENPSKPKKYKKRARPQPQWDVLEEYYRGGYSLRSIAKLPEADGVSFQAVAKHAEKHDWVRDLSDKAQFEANKRLALLKFQNLGVTNPNPDAINAVAAENLDVGDRKAAKKVTTTVIKEALTHQIFEVKLRQQNRSDKLRAAWDHAMNLIEELTHLDLNDEAQLDRAARIRTAIGSPKDSLTDILSKLASTHATLQMTEQRIYGLDKSGDEDFKPILPKIARRGAIRHDSDDENDD